MELPVAYLNRMREMLGGEYGQFLAQYDKPAHQALRFNPLKKGLEPAQYAGLLETLGVDAVHPVPWAEDAYYYVEREESFSDDGEDLSTVQEKIAVCRPGKDIFHDIGLYYIQEPSAMAVAGILLSAPVMVSADERILDLCAAPGGKSTQLAAAMRGQGLLVCNEIHPARAKILSQNIERMGISNAIVTNDTSAKLAQKFPEYFHRILVDAPCSGEGMFRKNPSAVEEWSPENGRMCAERQAQILDDAAQMLLPGGVMAYSTCTFSPEEDEGTVAAFLQRHPEFSLLDVHNRSNDNNAQSGYKIDGKTKNIGEESHMEKIVKESSLQVNSQREDGNPILSCTQRIWPHKAAGEGHFVALFKKKAHNELTDNPDFPYEILLQENSQTIDKIQKGKNGKKCDKGSKATHASANFSLDKVQLKILQDFLKDTLVPEIADWILHGNLILFGEQLYRLPEDAPSLDGLHVLRPGLQIGTFRKNRFEPAHALALWLGQNDVMRVADLPRTGPAEHYLHGEAIPIFWKINEEDTKPEGQPQDATEYTVHGNVSESGWTLVCCEGYSAGWGKVSNHILKNHYPKGLRR